MIAKLGGPAKKGRKAMSEATAETIQEWSYPDRGLKLAMADDDKGGQSITAITIKAPATFKTRLGIGIGSSRKEVIDAYGKLRDPEFPPGDKGDKEEVFLAGSIYGGVFFTFNKKDQVSEIFVGAGAE